MLREDSELPLSVAGSYASPNAWDVDYVVRFNDQIDGVMTFSFGLDFTDNHSYRLLDLPASPHAVIHRIFVRVSERGRGVGPRLIRELAQEAVARGCTFIVGSLDRTSEVAERRRFFSKVGFTVARDDTFGAAPGHVLETIARLPH